MPRMAREKSSTGLYHIVVRGINQQNIFEDNEDRQRFVERLAIVKKELKFELYAYCLMSNHVHLLLKQNKTDLSAIMKRIQTSYVYFFNWKYERCGHLFQDRYKSECIEDDAYFYTVIRYIHQNPVKAGMSTIDNYKWSSYNDYIKLSEITDTYFFLEMLGQDYQNRYINFMNEENEDKCLEIEEKRKLTDEKAREAMRKISKLKNIMDIQKLENLKRDKILNKCKEIDGISILQISRLTGINRGIIKSA